MNFKKKYVTTKIINGRLYAQGVKENIAIYAILFDEK